MNDVIAFLKTKGKLVHTGYSEDEICRLTYRTSHLCVCNKCDKLYIDHPYIDDVLDSDGRPFLHQLCNGDVIKL